MLLNIHRPKRSVHAPNIHYLVVQSDNLFVMVNWLFTEEPNVLQVHSILKYINYVIHILGLLRQPCTKFREGARLSRLNRHWLMEFLQTVGYVKSLQQRVQKSAIILEDETKFECLDHYPTCHVESKYHLLFKCILLGIYKICNSEMHKRVQ